MAQSDFIRDLAKFGLSNDQENLQKALAGLIDYFKDHRQVNFAIQLQSLLREAIRQQGESPLVKVGSPRHILREEDREFGDLIMERLTSNYRLKDLICSETVEQELSFFIEEHRSLQLLRKFELPVSNKVLFHGPSGCGKTLGAYVLSGELQKLMVVVNLGAIVSSKLGETSRNLAKIFRKATTEGSIVFIDEFDSLGKVRDYSQDHGEMKRVVNTILQLFDYLPQDSIVIGATNQVDMIDEALLRRFDLQLQLNLPDEQHIRAIIDKTLQSDRFTLDKPASLRRVIEASKGLSYYQIQKTLIAAIKRSLLGRKKSIALKVDTAVWLALIEREKKYLLAKE